MVLIANDFMALWPRPWPFSCNLCSRSVHSAPQWMRPWVFRRPARAIVHREVEHGIAGAAGIGGSSGQPSSDFNTRASASAKSRPNGSWLLPSGAKLVSGGTCCV